MDKRTVQVVALITAIVLFILAGLGAGGHVNGVAPAELADFGLAALAVGVLVP